MKQRILVVDDTPDALEMMRVLLSENYDVDTATSASEALSKYYGAIAEGCPFSLLIIDAALPSSPNEPKMSGFNVAEVIRVHDTVTPLAIHSAYTANEESKRRAIGLNASLWQKPDDSGRLPELVDELIGL